MSRRASRSKRGRHRVIRLAVLCVAVVLASVGAKSHDPWPTAVAIALVLADIFV